MRPSAAIQHIRHIAAQGLPPLMAVPAMVDALEELVPARTRTFVWLDEQGYTASLYEREPIPDALDAFNLATAELVARGEPSVIDLATAPDEFGGWRRFLHHPLWDRSVMKNELFRPYGIGNNLDFPLRDRGQTRALLAICREPGSRAFTRAEVEAVLTLRPHFLYAMQAPETLALACEKGGDVALALIGDDGTVCDASAEARFLMYQLCCGPNGNAPVLARRAPPAVRDIISRLSVHESAPRHDPPTRDVRTAWGSIRITAHMRATSGETVVTLQRFLPKAMARLDRLRQLDLSPREREVAFAMGALGSGDEIASTMGLTIGAYRQMAKRIYSRLGVTGRDGVRQLLDS